MAIKKTLTQIEEVQTTISAVLAGKEISRNGKTLTLEDLGPLEKREEKLLARYHREQGRGSTRNTGLMRRY